MTEMFRTGLSRRALLKGGGAIVVSFSLSSRGAFSQEEEAKVVDQSGELPGSL